MTAITRIYTAHIATEIERRFTHLLDISDVKSASQAQRSMAIKTRGLAAYALVCLVPGLSDADAANHVTDGSGDCGIDALYVQPTTSAIFVVQSKWHDEGTGSIGLGDLRNTIGGIKYLMDSRYDRFNSKFANILPQVESAFDNVNVSVNLAIAVTGSSTLAQEPQTALDDFIEEMNEISELLAISHLGLADLRRFLTSGSGGAKIDMDVTLLNWGLLTDPYTAYYGLIEAATVASWYKQYGGQLFDQNLRKALGATPVNSSLIKTLTDEPQNFWYFNNGITVLSESVDKTMRGGASRQSGDFQIKGLSIVNGAQTVSSIANVARSAPEKLGNVSVWIRIISLRDAPDGFATEVTRTTNTQNSVESRDFLSLDPEQDRLRTDMVLSLKKSYVFRRGEIAPKPDQGCTVQEAIISLACAKEDSTFAVLAKSAIGRLEERDGRYYPQLFNSKRTVFELWQSVVIYRAIETALLALRSELLGRDRAVAQQGNRIIAHIVMRDLGGLNSFGREMESKTFENLIDSIPVKTKEALESLIAAVTKLYPANYITSLFKNASKCDSLVAQVASN
ncbi:AIPR protein [Rathayibacter sp. PhB151]|uniref:AIPR family protein n=1 Tax=Rathayibacter sp. PhB151 TaxID=2485189 RepID=UPI0010645665|nr:AIPR family protein [Rathayibacter sp. PhB151]TDX75977.1 AIPR protein [Rathayibacter sp. PhB151]